MNIKNNMFRKIVTGVLIAGWLLTGLHASPISLNGDMNFIQQTKQLVYDPPTACIEFFDVQSSNYRGTYAISHKFTTNGTEKYEVTVGYNSLDNVARKVRILVTGVSRATGSMQTIYDVSYGSPTRSLSRTYTDIICGEYTYVIATVEVLEVNSNVIKYASNIAEASIDPFNVVN